MREWREVAKERAMMGDMGVGGTAALVARLQARQVGQGTELGVKVGCSQKR